MPEELELSQAELRNLDSNPALKKVISLLGYKGLEKLRTCWSKIAQNCHWPQLERVRTVVECLTCIWPSWDRVWWKTSRPNSFSDYWHPVSGHRTRQRSTGKESFWINQTTLKATIVNFFPSSKEKVFFFAWQFKFKKNIWKESFNFLDKNSNFPAVIIQRAQNKNNISGWKINS